MVIHSYDGPLLAKVLAQFFFVSVAPVLIDLLLYSLRQLDHEVP